MKLKTSLWLICKTYVSLKFGSFCIITAHFSSCPFISCQAFQAGFPYAPVKTDNCFKRLKHLYFPPPNCLRMFVFKKENQQISAIKQSRERESFFTLSTRSSPCVCASLIFYASKFQVSHHYLAQGTGGFEPIGIGEGQVCFLHCLIKVCLYT